MKKRFLSLILALALCLGLAVPVCAADYSFTDDAGTDYTVPEAAFASGVVSFIPGDPQSSYGVYRTPENALGAPESGRYSLCLGVGGVLVLRFDVAIYDGEGPDLCVLGAGSAGDAAKVEVSDDLSTWYAVGTAQGSYAALDFSGSVPEGTSFRYVRLTDAGVDDTAATAHWPGDDIRAVCGLNVRSICSSWAEAEVTRADELGLIPDSLELADLTQPITRAEFAALCVRLYEDMGRIINYDTLLGSTPMHFDDCSDADVQAAYSLGIVNGVSDTTFAPDAMLTREQAAAMLTRVYKSATIAGWTLATDKNYPLTYTMPEAFADDALISNYARESVYFMAANSIINGFTDHTFRPKNVTDQQTELRYANTTRQQAICLALRMVEHLG